VLWLQITHQTPHSAVPANHKTAIPRPQAHQPIKRKYAITYLWIVTNNIKMIDWLSLSFSLLLPLYYSLDNGPSLLSSITLPPSSPSPAFTDSTPGGGSLLNGPHSYTPNTEAIKVCFFSSWLDYIQSVSGPELTHLKVSQKSPPPNIMKSASHRLKMCFLI